LHSDGKDKLILKVKALNKEFISVIYRSLSVVDLRFVNANLENNVQSSLCKILDYDVTGNNFEAMACGCHISTYLMGAILQLFKKRTNRIADVYRESYSHKPDFSPLSTSLFFENTSSAERALADKCQLGKYVYILEKTPENIWYMFYIDINSHKIYTLHPHFANEENFTADFTLAITPQIERIQIALKIVLPNENFQKKKYAYQFHNVDIAVCDTGVYVALVIYHLENRCPIAFKRSQLTNLRQSLSYWLLLTSLPY
jgi:hypothetical protein